MRLRERTQVDYARDALLDIDPCKQAKKSAHERSSSRVKESSLPALSDEIEHSQGEESEISDEPDAISDDSSNSDGEVPVATNLTGRLQHKKQRRAADRNGNNDVAEGGKTGTKKSQDANSLLKYLKPNVSNVEDAPRPCNAGSDSDDTFEEAPSSLQAGRRKRKVVARRRASRNDPSDGEDDSPVKENPRNPSKSFENTRTSTRALQQSKVSYKDASSSDEEFEVPASRFLESVPNRHVTLEAIDTAKKIVAKDPADLDIYSLHRDDGVNEEETTRTGTLKCYSRQSKSKSTVNVNEGEKVNMSPGERLSQRATRARNVREVSSSDDEEIPAGEKVSTPAVERRSHRIITRRNVQAPTSDEGDVECADALTEEAAAPERKLRRLQKLADPVMQDCRESVKEKSIASLNASEARDSQYDPPTIYDVGIYGIEREGDNSPVPVVKRIGRVEKILSVRRASEASDSIFCVKEYGKCYRSVVHVKENTLLNQCPQLLRNFLKRLEQLGRVDGHGLDLKNSPAFDPLYTKIDRIVAQDVQSKKKLFLVKWCRLPYSESTWEKEENLQKDLSAISRFMKFNSKITRPVETTSRKPFKDGRALRDYQEAGVAWLDHNFENRTNCILADEMGLGKTIQSVAMLETLRWKRKIRGPFLVIAPVSTLGHWQREVESLTDMNCVVYTGNQEDREIIRQHEFYFSESNSKALKFNVLLTSFEILMKDQNKFAKEIWPYIIVDEAHRLKSNNSKTTQSLKQLQYRKGGLLLLTGTPVQNNTKEIFSLLNLLDKDTFSSEEDFMEKYGEIKDAEQIKDLQDNILRPRLLRRMKDDVEKSIPQKEETIVWVELTKDQRAYYKGIYENNIASLLKGNAGGNLPNLRNVAMELRKICNHPFLCDGLEADLVAKHNIVTADADTSGELLQQSSGKMVLVDKLLPKLKDAGRRVLIFSQFTVMLDLLEDYLTSKGYSYERIDGKIRGSERQAAIDRYSAKDSNIFVFLLSTRAGGLGITLTAADTCIIYDSDWNPQNDLQAMARCHRIGQTKDVKIYRLITRNTYEQRLFECSSRKYGLDEAILGNRVGADANLDHDKNIESLLKHGAYDILKDDGEEEAAEFTAQDIDQILEQRTQQRQIGGRGNNTFSVATFKTNPDAEMEWEQEKNDSKAFWNDLMPEACDRAVAESTAVKEPEASHAGGLRKRNRGHVDYRENSRRHDVSDLDEETEKPKKSGRKQFASSSADREESEEDEDDIDHWSDREFKRLEDRLFALGRGRTEQIQEEAGLNHRSREEIDEVSEALIEACKSCVSLGKPVDVAGANNVTNCALTSTSLELKQSSVGVPPTLLPNVSDMGDPNKLPLDQHPTETLKPDSKSLPAVVVRVMESKLCKGRIQRNAQRYLQQLHERNVLSAALEMRALEFMHMPVRSKKLPMWWGKQEDEDLLRAAYKHGHRDFRKIKSDNDISFVKRFVTSSDQDALQKDETAASGEKETMPSDQVLGSRLKRLIESLPHGLSTEALNKRASKAEASRKFNAERRKLSSQLSPNEGKKAVSESTEKSLEDFYTLHPAKQIEDTSTNEAQATHERKSNMPPVSNKHEHTLASPPVPPMPTSATKSIEDASIHVNKKAKSPHLQPRSLSKQPLAVEKQTNTVSKTSELLEQKSIGCNDLPHKGPKNARKVIHVLKESPATKVAVGNPHAIGKADSLALEPPTHAKKPLALTNQSGVGGNLAGKVLRPHDGVPSEAPLNIPKENKAPKRSAVNQTPTAKPSKKRKQKESVGIQTSMKSFLRSRD